jgi:hypothetical protein
MEGQIGFPEGQFSWFATVMKAMGDEAGRKFFQGLARQNLHFRNSQVLVTQFVAAGEFSLGFVYDTQVLRFKKRGAPLDIAPMPFITKNIHPIALAALRAPSQRRQSFHRLRAIQRGANADQNMGRVVSRSDIPQEDFARAKIIPEEPPSPTGSMR